MDLTPPLSRFHRFSSAPSLHHSPHRHVCVGKPSCSPELFFNKPNLSAKRFCFCPCSIPSSSSSSSSSSDLGGFSDAQTFHRWDRFCSGFVQSGFVDSGALSPPPPPPPDDIPSSDSCFLPQLETGLDPFSQLLCQNYIMGKNMQWWRFLLYYCRSQLNRLSARKSMFYNLETVDMFSFTRTNKIRVLLTSRAKEALIFSGFSIAQISDLEDQHHHIRLFFRIFSLKYFMIWIEDMSHKYGSSFLWLLGLGYFIQGFRCFPWLAMSFHLKDGFCVNPATLQFLQSTVNLPMVIKPVFGIISDAGNPRKLPYLMIAGLIQVVSWSTIALHSQMRYSIIPLMGLLLLSNTGAALAEVVNDALVAKAICKERANAKGELQSFFWIALAFGGIIGNLTAGMALSKLRSTVMFSIFSIVVASQVVVCTLVKESSFNSELQRKKTKIVCKDESLSMVKKQGIKLLELVTNPQISGPLTWFVLSYAMVPTLGGSLFFYQTQHLKIPPTFLGLAKVMGQMGLFAGSILYNLYFKKSSPRKVIMVLQILLAICMMSDIFLVSRLNIKAGIPDRFYILGASAFVEAIAQFKVLPFSIMLSQLCPPGSEASLLSFFMSCHCLALIVSGYTGTMMASFLNLSVDSFVGLPLGILIQSLAALLPLLWISCIPSNLNKRVVL